MKRARAAVTKYILPPLASVGVRGAVARLAVLAAVAGGTTTAVVTTTATAPQPTTVEMFDNVTVSLIPSDATAVAGYVSGRFANFDQMVAAFPKASHISIATNRDARAQCLDVEPGDAVPSDAGTWTRNDIAAGFKKPCLYSSISEIPQVVANLTSTGFARSQYFLWCAHYTFVQHQEPGCDATQWTDHARGISLDESTVTPAFLGVVVTPPPVPVPPAKITHWRQARNSSFSQYHKHGCKTLVDDSVCRLLGDRVEYFQGKLWTVFPKWGCWGRKAKTKSAVCWVVRPTVSRWSQERDATASAQARNSCTVPASFGVPSHSRLCKVLDQRRKYFDAKVSAYRKEYA